MKTKPTFRYGPTIGEMRLSRLSHPRGTLFAMILLAVVFLLFGLLTSAVDVTHTATPHAVDNSAVSVLGHWVMSAVGVS